MGTATIRKFWLFARSRQILKTALLIVVSIVLMMTLIGIVPGFPGLSKPLTLVASTVYAMPLFPACIIASVQSSHFGRWEKSLGNDLPRLRTIILIILMIWTWGWLVIVVPDIPSYSHIDLAFTRNLFGLVGIAHLSAWLFGGRLSWVLPILYICAAVFFGTGIASYSQESGMPLLAWKPWAWVFHSGGNQSGYLLAFLSWLIGSAVVIGKGTKV